MLNLRDCPWIQLFPIYEKHYSYYDKHRRNKQKDSSLITIVPFRHCAYCFLMKALCDFPLQGFVHLAIQSRLPIVSIVLTGTHLAWRKGSLHVRPAPLTVKYLPPIKTDDWTTDKINDHVKLIHGIYMENLPQTQRPLLVEEETPIKRWSLLLEVSTFTS